jgi:hypothetical protein
VHSDPRLAVTVTRLITAIAKGGQKPGGGGKLQAYGFGGKYVSGGGSAPTLPSVAAAGSGVFSKDEQELMDQSLTAEYRMAKVAMLANSGEDVAKATVVEGAAMNMWIMAQKDPALKAQLETMCGDVSRAAFDTLKEARENGTVDGVKLIIDQLTDPEALIEQMRVEHPDLYQKYQDGHMSLTDLEIHRRFPNDPSARRFLSSNNDGRTRKLFEAEDRVSNMGIRLYLEPEQVIALYEHGGPAEIGARLAAQRYVESWAATAMDSKPESIALQTVAQQHWGLDEGSLSWAYEEARFLSVPDDVKTVVAREGLVMAAFHQSVYQETQRLFDAAGITEVVLARGTNADMSSGEFLMSPLSAMSVNVETATEFGDRVMLSTVPAERVYSTWMTGPGCMSEHEYIVLGSNHPDEFLVFDSSEVQDVIFGEEGGGPEYEEYRTPGYRLRVGEGYVNPEYVQTPEFEEVAPAEGAYGATTGKVGVPGTYYSTKPTIVPAGYEAKLVSVAGGGAKWGVYTKKKFPAVKKPVTPHLQTAQVTAKPGSYYINKPNTAPAGYKLVQQKTGKNKLKWKAVKE